jgi:molybdopterin molybdotransferase
MKSVDEALSLVLQRTVTLAPVQAPVSDVLNLVLAENITSDIDSPPHDKSLVDGYAVCSADLAQNGAELHVLEEVTAGAVPSKTVLPGTTSRIMTGVPIPAGADSVVMLEHTELLDGIGELPQVRILEERVTVGRNIMRRGTSLRSGEVVLSAGSILRPIEIGLLSEVGRTEVAVYPRPRVAVLATGNELVSPDAIPAAGQIRNSNGPMLKALVEQAGATAIDLGVARDEQDELRQLIERGLMADVLVLSGGVSAGVLDLIPHVLAQLGVEQVFHKVRLKPGKPLWFGVLKSPSSEKLVYGLPGNPVSSLVCFELFVRPALDRLAGRSGDRTATTARLTCEHQQRGDRPTYFPAWLQSDHGQRSVTPVAWKGSADLRSLAAANCLAIFPAGDRQFAAGDEIEVRLFFESH